MIINGLALLVGLIIVIGLFFILSKSQFLIHNLLDNLMRGVLPTSIYLPNSFFFSP